MAETKTPTKPDCYECIHRGEVPGSAHSCCNHPATEAVRSSSLAQLFALMVGAPPMPVDGLNVVGHKHGIRMGWFAWPLNFDPTWLESCDGFEARAALAKVGAR